LIGLIDCLTQIDKALKGLLKIQKIKSKFLKYMSIDSRKVSSIWGEESTVMTSRKELKKEAAREEWEKLLTS
jgi:uncharacterized protein YabN with tetrapyrrole methylase and pyrophosphatase domain